jgi:uncharacterized Zn-finger protein
MEKKFICPICGRDISRKDNYRVHLKSHTANGASVSIPNEASDSPDHSNDQIDLSSDALKATEDR